MSRGGKNWDLPLLVDAQNPKPLMMTTSSQNGKRQYTWNEIRLHSNKKDRWIVIDKHVYDITRWTKHPGGQLVLNYYAGQDATEAFRALHPDTAIIQKYLKAFYIGDVNEDEGDDDTVSVKDDQALKDDFEQLRQKAISKKLFQSSPLYFLLTCLHILAFEFAGYFVLFRFGTTWLPYLLTFILFVISGVQSAWIQHDFSHLSVFKTSIWNHRFHRFFIGFLNGVTADWWNHMHVQHHAKPNIIDKDPHTRVEPVFLLGDTIPIRKAQTNAKYGKEMPYNLQHLYYFIVAPLLFPFYFEFLGICHAISRRKWIDLASVSIYYIKIFGIMPLKLGLFGGIKLHVLVRVCQGIWYGTVTQSNHMVMDVSHDDSNMSWVRMHLKATCNLNKSLFNDWFTGHLNFQIEHHLFPRMPRHNLYKIQPEVKELCQKYNIPYVDKPMGQAFFDIFTSLEKSGQLWLEAYEELIQSKQTD